MDLISIDKGFTDEVKKSFISEHIYREGSDAEFWENIKKNNKLMKLSPKFQTLLEFSSLAEITFAGAHSLRQRKRTEIFTFQSCSDWDKYLSKTSQTVAGQDGNDRRTRICQKPCRSLSKKYNLVDLSNKLKNLEEPIAIAQK